MQIQSLDPKGNKISKESLQINYSAGSPGSVLPLYDADSHFIHQSIPKRRGASLDSEEAEESREVSTRNQPASRRASGKGIYLEVHNITEHPVDDERGETVDDLNADKSVNCSTSILSPVNKKLDDYLDVAKENYLPVRIVKNQKALS